MIEMCLQIYSPPHKYSERTIPSIGISSGDTIMSPVDMVLAHMKLTIQQADVNQQITHVSIKL
jgi:hypothetical protein